MSIINDALKKTQNQLNHSRTTSTPPKTQLNPLIIFLLISIAFLFSVYLIIQRLERSLTVQKPETIENTVPVTLSTQPIITETLPEQKTTPPNFTLNGIMVMNNQRVALINGNVYETDSQIDGYTIIDISMKNATLIKGDESLILTIKNEE